MFTPLIQYLEHAVRQLEGTIKTLSYGTIADHFAIWLSDSVGESDDKMIRLTGLRAGPSEYTLNLCVCSYINRDTLYIMKKILLKGNKAI